MKTKIGHDIKRLKREAKIKADNLKKELEQESVRLSHAVAHKTLEIVSQAELDAVKLRAQARQEALQQKFAHTGIDFIETSQSSESPKVESAQSSEFPKVSTRPWRA